jgi:hypothetical protein
MNLNPLLLFLKLDGQVEGGLGNAEAPALSPAPETLQDGSLVGKGLTHNQLALLGAGVVLCIGSSLHAEPQSNNTRSAFVMSQPHNRSSGTAPCKIDHIGASQEKTRLQSWALI